MSAEVTMDKIVWFKVGPAVADINDEVVKLLGAVFSGKPAKVTW